jgi:hypothetical protein
MRRRALTLVEEDAVAHGLLAQEDVLRHGQHGYEHEVLVDHADTPVDGVGGIGDVHDLAVEQDLTLVWLGQAVEDVHERGLAGAVLT